VEIEEPMKESLMPFLGPLSCILAGISSDIIPIIRPTTTFRYYVPRIPGYLYSLLLISNGKLDGTQISYDHTR